VGYNLRLQVAICFLSFLGLFFPAASIYSFGRAAHCARNMRASAENQFVIKTTNEKDIKVDM